MSYDMVGIAGPSTRSGVLPTETPGAALHRALVEEKWASREIDLATLSVSRTALREAATACPGGIAAVGALMGGRPTASLATFFGVVSSDPALASISMARESVIARRLEDLDHLGVSVLAVPQQSLRRALTTTSDGAIPADISWQLGFSETVLFTGASLWLDCRIHSVVEANEQVVLLLVIHGSWTNREALPMRWVGSGQATET